VSLCVQMVSNVFVCFLRQQGVVVHLLDVTRVLPHTRETRDMPLRRRMLEGTCSVLKDNVKSKQLHALFFRANEAEAAALAASTKSSLHHPSPLASAPARPSSSPSSSLPVRFVAPPMIAENCDGDVVLLQSPDVCLSYLACILSASDVSILQVPGDVTHDDAGFYSGDRRLVLAAAPIREATYEESYELATFSSVLHPGALPPLQQNRIRLRLMAFEDEEEDEKRQTEQKGRHFSSSTTLVTRIGPNADPSRVKGVFSKPNVVVVRMQSATMWLRVGVLADLFATFARCGVSVDSVSTSATSVFVSLDGIPSDRTRQSLIHNLALYCTQVEVIEDCVAVTIIGGSSAQLGMNSMSRVLASSAQSHSHQVYIVSHAGSSVTMVLKTDLSEAILVNQLHSVHFNKEGKEEEVVVVGTKAG